ncbi:hypothetical protein PACTADRAFT_44510 [Pachysolen tannophilus NRRL Y-2460]|uniref:peptidyl-tRNA hydrolase n=1 Tax=Pachysolen tannophilus NRRL Y-2460 TaxID=669874 RepID=A0A1E4TRG4_PACTA|nr:hypothetical protein PACTADRAFT_44510 [Pachysolen tannophilus NRRL Y-2460]
MSSNQVVRYVAVSAIALAVGVFLGSQVPLLQNPICRGSTEEEEEEEEEEIFEVDSRPLNEIPGECRIALIVRTDLQMGKGKAAAQCCHAAIALYRLMLTGEFSKNLQLLERWENSGQAKITLKCDNQEDMDLLYARAISLNINSYIVHDAGRTQIAAGSATVLGLGPAPKAVLDQVTKDLKLY